MDDLTPISRAVALDEIPDAPGTLEFRGMALDRRSTIYRSRTGLLLCDADETMLGAMGDVLPHHVRELFEPRRITCELLADRRAFTSLNADFDFERATILTLEREWRHPPGLVLGLVVRRLQSQDRLGHVPVWLREKIERQAMNGEVWAGFVARGTAVSFAYVATNTESLADISIDTLGAWRGVGIGRNVASFLVGRVVALGKTPVWGATIDNAASLALAKTLGFTRPAGELFVHEK